MPLTRMKDDYTMSDGVKFWMADEGRPVLCRVTHEALRDHADTGFGLMSPMTRSSKPIASLLNRSQAMLTTRAPTSMTQVVSSLLRRRSTE
jgi:hypothetical protein